MNAILLMTLFVPALLSPGWLQLANDLPGESFLQPPQGTVLRSGPSPDYPGVLTLDGTTVVRAGTARGVYRQIFVSGGFPVYLHEDYVTVHPEDAQVSIIANRVNMRLLPALEGNIPVGQLDAGQGPVDLLGTEGEWVRVLAPVKHGELVITGCTIMSLHGQVS